MMNFVKKIYEMEFLVSTVLFITAYIISDYNHIIVFEKCNSSIKISGHWKHLWNKNLNSYL